jgi:predicted metallopeptidase
VAKKTHYKHAKEVEDIALDLIPKYHGHLLDFKVHLEYVFVSKAPKRNGKEIWGQCRKVTGFNAYLADQEGDEPFYVIIISEPVWEVLPQDKRVALVDHELCHAWAKANQKEDDDESDLVKLSLRPHDLEEFSCIVRRHGLWREDIEDFVEAALKSKGGNDEGTDNDQSDAV